MRTDGLSKPGMQRAHKCCSYTFRYTGHKNTDYRIDSCLNSKDTHILSGSEDGQVYIWDLIEVY